MKLEPKTRYVIEALYQDEGGTEWSYWLRCCTSNEAEALATFRRVKRTYRTKQFRLVREITSREQIAPKLP